MLYVGSGFSRILQSTAKGVVHQRRIGDRLRERADVIEAPGQRDDTVGGKFSMARLQTDDAAGGGRNADRSASISAERGQGHAGGDAGRRPAARAARRTTDVAR